MAFLRNVISWFRIRRRNLSTYPSLSIPEERQGAGLDVTFSETTMDTTANGMETTGNNNGTAVETTEKRRKEMAEIRKMKAKKARRKPLPAKIHQKRKEKRKKQKKVSTPKKKKDRLIKDDEGRVFLRRLPIPDNPAYEGIVRNLLEEMPPDTEQDILDGVYVHAIACEINWIEADEEQMLPRVEELSNKEYSKLKKERATEYAQTLKAFNKWVFAMERFKSPEIADILVVRKNGDKPLPVPWIGGEDPKSNSDERKHNDSKFRNKKKKHSKRKAKHTQWAEDDVEEKSDDETKA